LKLNVAAGFHVDHVLLCREGWRINHKKIGRIYRELGLRLRNETQKRRVKAKLRDDRREAARPNETWAMDFVHDQLATERKIRILKLVDILSRYSLAIDSRFSYQDDVWFGFSIKSAPRSAIRAPFKLTRGRSSSRAISSTGPTSVASRSTSRGQAIRLTTPSSKPSTVASARNVLTPIGS
jgi:putative transposase